MDYLPQEDRYPSPQPSPHVVEGYRYIPVELTKEEDKRWSVRIPALAAYVAWGRTKADALRNATRAIEGYMQRHKSSVSPS